MYHLTRVGGRNLVRGIATLIHILPLKFTTLISPVGDLLGTEHVVKAEAGGGQALESHCCIPLCTHTFRWIIAQWTETAEVDLEQAQTSLDRAIWCFEQADNSELAAKARTYRLSIQLCLNLTSAHHPIPIHKNEQAFIEMEGAQLMASLAKEGLLYEVLNVFSSIRSFLSTYANVELERCSISNQICDCQC